MRPKRHPRPTDSFPWRSASSAVLAVLLLVAGPAAFTDDTNLLRFDTAKPYVFIVLDTSMSMNLAFEAESDQWTPGGADGPGSRLYQAKQALFNVFDGVTDVHFGFAAFNQDRVRANWKHWLYYHQTQLPQDWPLPFPQPEPANQANLDADEDGTVDEGAVASDGDVDDDGSFLTKLVGIPRVDEDGNPAPETDIDGNELPPDKDTRQLEIAGHLMTFGAPFPAVGRTAGTCTAPLDLTTIKGLQQAQTFAIDGRSPEGGAPTGLWFNVSGSRNADYFMTVVGPDPAGTGVPVFGQSSMNVVLRLYTVSSCPFSTTSLPAVPAFTATLTMLRDPVLSETFYIDTLEDSNKSEGAAHLWEHQDALSDTAFGAHPFTGEGWEGNYDSGGIDPAGDSTFQTSLDNNELDSHCADSSNGTGKKNCAKSQYVSEVKPTATTVFNNVGRRALDYGDMIPFDWGAERLSLFLEKLNPAGTDPPDFRAATYFRDQPETVANVPASVDFLPLQLKDGVNLPHPLLAMDQSPLARAINDVRCWYLGGNTNKCNSANPLVAKSWESFACEFDSSFGCRKPYLILISDGEDNGGKGEAAVADVSDLFNRAGMRTWALNLGDPDSCRNGTLHSIVNAAGTGQDKTGECINVSNGSQLRQELESILGQILTETRAFASAAVPTVQATVEEKIFLTDFTPFNDSGVWDGHVRSFLKPLPVDEITSKPDSSRVCKALGLTRQCLLWDAGQVLLNQQYQVADSEVAASEQVPVLDVDGNDGALRRVYYGQRARFPGRWANGLRIFQQPAADEPETREDLWQALEVADESTTDEIVNFTLRRKVGTSVDSINNTTEKVPVLLGDIFHSTPQVIGTPTNVFFFANDTFADLDDPKPCLSGNGAANQNTGYRCFFERQRLRRKMLIVGSNDGQFHVFDAGRFRGRKNGNSDETLTDFFTDIPLVCTLDDVQDPNDGCFGRNPTPFGRFDNGTGKELFSYVPRLVMPTLRLQEETPSQHFFSVDGNVTVSDVFIDPVDGTKLPRDAATATFPDPDEREWRTVAIGSLREGGAGYFALDITQPDPLEQTEDAEVGFVPLVSQATNDPSKADYLPGCLRSVDEEGAPKVEAGCGTLPFPAVLWEFTDSFWDPETTAWYQVDEDEAFMLDAFGKGIFQPDPDKAPEADAETGETPPAAVPESDPSFGVADLGDSWSTVNVGWIRVCATGGSACAPGEDDVEDRFVAVFGGGMDPESASFAAGSGAPLAETRGNWLYMVDVETGQVIYKQRLHGAAPSEPAAVDTNGDGRLDRIYIGTLAGYLYRVDLDLIDGEYPALVPLDIPGIGAGGSTATVMQDRLPRDVWRPVKLFDANFDGTTALDGFRPIFYRPSVIFRAGGGDYALAFGTGDRFDLWSIGGEPGRFYVFLDPFSSTAAISQPINEGNLGLAARIEVGVTPVAQGGDLLSSGGWYLVLDEDERVITEAFALSGLTIFSAYEPRIFIGEETADEEEGERVCGDDGNQGNQGNETAGDRVCSLRGNSNIYVLNTTNGDGLLFDEANVQTRTKVVADFVTNPFTEPGQSKTSGSGDGDTPTADDLTVNMKKVMDTLKDLFPAQCKFANYRVDVKTIAADTSLQFIAPVPVCIIEHNWKEF